MFKLGSKFQSMDINKNIETAKFFPGHRAFVNSRNRANNTFEKKVNYENKKTIVNKNPPIFFYRKVNTPYKYNMTSVPEYLIKTNEEKHFVNKLFQSIRDESDKRMLNSLIRKRKLKSRKDANKPQILELQNLLQYRPNLYKCYFSPDSKPLDNNQTDQEHHNVLEEKQDDKSTIKNDDNINNKNLSLKTFSSIDNDLSTIQQENKSNIININRVDEELLNNTQIKYKYKLSDIFNLRKEPVFTNKSAEKYLYKELKERQNKFMMTSPNMPKIKNIEEDKNKFYVGSESKSDWIPNKINYKKMGTYSSVAYNIISPMFQGQNRFITATELNKNNLYNESPTFHRVKSISEFIDLTSVSATNTLGCFDRNKKMPNFRFRNSVATNQSDEYYINRHLIDKPI